MIMKMTKKVLFTTKTLSSLRYYRVLYLNTFFKSSVYSVCSVVKFFNLSFYEMVKSLSFIINNFLSFNKINKCSVYSVRSVVNYSDNYSYTSNG